MDKIQTSEIAKFESKFLEHLRSSHSDLLEQISKTGVMTKEADDRLGKILDGFMEQGGFALKSGNW